ncbi:hypothetical protein C0992_001183 [Termitomyces sp. T32_za158]|nr:hypothetical protein C0992_001183 [Termitomyces sp. T32_za158]
MGPFLFGGLIALVMTGFVGVFLPFGKTMDLIYAIGGCLLFSGYIVYDTYLINAKLSPDEFIMGAISLYLECVVLILVYQSFLTAPENQFHQFVYVTQSSVDDS